MKTGQRRMIHFSLYGSAQVANLSIQARHTYIGLIVLGDDDGRLKADPRLIKSQLYPYDDEIKVSDVVKWMKEVADQRLVVEYEVEGVKYIYHPKWEDYQQLREDRRRDSNIPAPTLEFFPLSASRQPNDNQVSTKPPHKISKGKISKEKLIPTAMDQDGAFHTFWDLYPKKVGKKAAWKAWGRINLNPELWEKIRASLVAHTESEGWTKDSGRYIPHAATWLNGERWEDEIKTGAAKSKKYANTTSKTVHGG